MISTLSKSDQKAELKRTFSVAYLIHDVGRLFRRSFEEEARHMGVTLPQWRALAEISRNPDISQVALATAIDAGAMTVSGILDRLEKRGLIERYPDPTDSRAKLTRVTAAGADIIKTARDVALTINAAALAGMSAGEQKALTDALQRVRENLSRLEAEQKEAV
jgi:DNA-binding MarR family transcriptional regulator